MIERREIQLLLRYLDGEAPPEERARTERLLETSARARREFDYFRQADIQLGRLGLFPLSSSYDQSFREKLSTLPPPWPEKTRMKKGSWRLGFILPLTAGRGLRIAAVAAAAIVLAIALPLLTRGPLPRTGTVIGTARIYRGREAAWFAAVRGMTVREGDLLRTAGVSSLELVSPDRYVLKISGDSELVVKKVVPARRKGETALVLEKGFLLARTEKNFPGSSLAVETPLGRSIVRGTAFRLAAGPAGTTELSVAEGQVKLVSFYRSVSVKVEAGYETVIRPEYIPEKPRRMTAGRLKILNDELAELGRGSDPVVTEKEAAIKEKLLDLILSETPGRVDELLQRPVLFVGPAVPPEVKTLLVRGGDLVRKGDYADGVALLQQVLNSYPDPRYDSTIELLLGAYHYGLLNDPEKALEIFDRVAAAGDPRWSGLARIAAARVHERLAEQGYRKVLETDSEGVDAAQARRRLERIAGGEEGFGKR